MFKRFMQSIWQAIIRTFAFISKEARTILHQPRLVFSLILGPFFILLIFGVGYRDAPRTLNTLFVVPEGSEIEALVEEYATALGGTITFAGITYDAAEADDRLKNGEVDLVVVTPINPMADWENDEQSKFSLYHSEVDPFEAIYIQVLGRRYVEEINKEVLISALNNSQQEATIWRDNVAEAKVQATNVRQSLQAGNAAAAKSSAEALKAEFDVLKLALGSSVAVATSLEEASGRSDASTRLVNQLDSVEEQIDDVLVMAENDTTLSEGATRAADVETSLAALDDMLISFQEMDTAVLVAPFRSEALNVTQVRIEPMHFYVPAVIALLLQHLAITLAGLSIIREKMGGAMELFRASPVSAFEMLVGKYGSYLLLTGSLAAVLTLLIIFALRVPQLGLWANYIVIILALLLASLGIGIHISLSARSDSQAIQYGMLTLLSAIFFSGFFLPLYRLAPGVRVISWLLPATYGTVLLQDTMLRGQSPQIVLILALFTFAAILFLLAWFRLGRQMAKE